MTNTLNRKTCSFSANYCEVTLFILSSVRDIINTLHSDISANYNFDLSDKGFDFTLTAEEKAFEKIQSYLHDFALILTKQAPLNKLSDTETIIMRIKEILDISALLLRLYFSQLPYDTENAQFEAVHQFIENFHKNLGENLLQFTSVSLKI